jgi:hypothetical protein
MVAVKPFLFYLQLSLIDRELVEIKSGKFLRFPKLEINSFML